MCYAKPGPRCSKHIREDMKKTMDKIYEVQSDLANATDSEEKERISERFTKLQGKLSTLRDDYLSTPKGQKELKDRYDEYFTEQDPQASFVMGARRHLHNVMVNSYNKRQEQVLEYSAKELAKQESAHEKLASNYAAVAELRAAINAYTANKPVETNPIESVHYSEDGVAEVKVHPDVSPLAVKQELGKAGVNTENVNVIKGTTDLSPALQHLPHFSQTDFRTAKNLGRVDSRSYFVSMLSDGDNVRRGVEIVFMEGIAEPHVVRASGARQNTKASAIAVPGPARKLKPVELLIAAKAARAGGLTYTFTKEDGEFTGEKGNFVVDRVAGQISRREKIRRQKYLSD